MLRTEFRFMASSRLQRAVALLLGEAFLGFLAIVAAALTLVPMIFSPPGPILASIETAQWAIIAWFAVEYVVAFLHAPSKGRFLRDGWRWIDLATILIPLASLLPTVSQVLRSSPILRLVRLARLVSLGVRASGIVVRNQDRRNATATVKGPVRITRPVVSGNVTPTEVSVADLIAWLQRRAAGWHHVANPTDDDLRRLGEAAALPAGFLETHLFAATHPHLAVGSDYAAVFLWSPQASLTEVGVDRAGLLVVAWGTRVLTFTRSAAGTAALRPFAGVAPESATEPLSLRVLAAALEHVVRENENVVGGFEQQLRALEDLPLRESRPEFFEQTFRLKKQLSAAQWDLWRLKAVLGQLGQRQSGVPGMTDDAATTFVRLSANVDYLYETVVNTREDVLGVIDLHLNVVSFDMNRVMRLLAVVSVLGLIPAVVGGLLGMNLIDNPWHFTLPQVTFGIGFGMLVGLYFFFVKGWLR